MHGLLRRASSEKISCWRSSAWERLPSKKPLSAEKATGAIWQRVAWSFTSTVALRSTHLERFIVRLVNITTSLDQLLGKTVSKETTIRHGAERSSSSSRCHRRSCKLFKPLACSWLCWFPCVNTCNRSARRWSFCWARMRHQKLSCFSSTSSS